MIAELSDGVDVSGLVHRCREHLHRSADDRGNGLPVKMRLAPAVASTRQFARTDRLGADLLVDSAGMTAEDQNQHVTNSVRDVDGTVVQAKHVGSLTVHGSPRTIVPLAAIFCVVLAVAGFVTWRLWPQDEQPFTGDPLAAASSLDGSCFSTGWVAP